MTDPEIGGTVDQHSEKQKARRDEVNKSETTATAKSGGWSSFSKIFDPRKEFHPIWNSIFVLSCVFAVSFDPLFFYIPIINEKNKCLYFDTRLKTIALLLRLLTDQFYIVDIILRILTSIAKLSKVTKTEQETPNPKGKVSVQNVLKKVNRSYIVIDILAILPIPQVGMLVFFSRMKGSGCSKERRLFDTLILLQFIPRVLPIYLLCGECRRIRRASMWTKGVFNFFLYILASHVLGAVWYFFAIQREMDCWYSVCLRHKGCPISTFSCNERRDRLSIIPSLNKECPTNLPKEMQGKPFEFGIFSEALASGLVKSTDFPQKFLNCFWWGLKNLSSLGQNLDTSTYALENLFAVFISIIGLLLFIYLIGNLQTYLQFATTRTEKLKRKMKTKKLELEVWLSRKGLPSNLKEVIMPVIQQKLEQRQDVEVDDILEILPSAHSKYIKRYLHLATLKMVPTLQAMGIGLLKAIGKDLKPVNYSEDSCIIKQEERLDKMIFIRHGTVQTYKTNGKGGKTGSEFLEKGDFFGAEELLNWASKFSQLDGLPFSSRMVKSVTKVEAYELSADDLKDICIKYWWNFTKNKELSGFDQSRLKEFAQSSIEKEICRRKIGKKKSSSKGSSLRKLATNEGSGSQKFQNLVTKVMKDQIPSPVQKLESS